jgi:hypothetical protein
MQRIFCLLTLAVRTVRTGSGLSGTTPTIEVIVNDRQIGDQPAARTTGSVPWQVGTYSGCAGAHGEEWLDFHHDNAGSKGLVEATYEPLLPRCGCYDVYEWHPSSHSCTSYLPRRVPLTVWESCGAGYERPTTVTFDQSLTGVEWVKVGDGFQLDAGLNTLVLSNRGTTDCATGVCYWVADALKLVYRNTSCTSGVAGRGAASGAGTCAVPAPRAATCAPKQLAAHASASGTAAPGSATARCPTAAPPAPSIPHGQHLLTDAQLGGLLGLSLCFAALAFLSGAALLRVRLRLRAAERGMRVVYLKPAAFPLHILQPDGNETLAMGAQLPVGAWTVASANELQANGVANANGTLLTAADTRPRGRGTRVATPPAAAGAGQGTATRLPPLAVVELQSRPALLSSAEPAAAHSDAHDDEHGDGGAPLPSAPTLGDSEA